MNEQIAIVTLSKRVTLEEVMAIAAACNRQAAEHVCPAWGVPFRPITVYADPSKLPPGTTNVCTLEDEPSQPGALGFHSVGPMPFARVSVSPILDHGGVVLCDPLDNQRQSVAACLSHECAIEVQVDPGCELYAVDGKGREIDIEPADPFQRNQYPLLVEMPWGDELVALSDFALPSWFKVGGQAPYNWMSDSHEHAGTGPFTIAAGGFAMADGDPLFAMRDGQPIHPPAWWLAMRPPGRRRKTKGPVRRRLYVAP